MKTSERFLQSNYLAGVVRVIDFGRDKHGDTAYLQKTTSYHLGKALKHCIAFVREPYDAETGENHLCHVGARVYFAYDCWLNRHN